jgi:hypothetical protein
MHWGVQQFIDWIQNNPSFHGLSVNPGAATADFTYIEKLIGAPLPLDLKLVLSQFNGAELPTGQLLRISGTDENAIDVVLSSFADQMGRPVSDPDLLLPFFRTNEESVLAFDRSAAPISDTWPIIDVSEGGEVLRLVFRTFEGWCRLCVAEWTAKDFGGTFTLEKYLEKGLRHVAIEPDISIAHATVAHAFRRLGEPERALQSYLQAGRCVPSQPWCDWEALKLAVLLGDVRQAIEAATRLCSRAPGKRWVERDTTPVVVADVLGQLAERGADRDIVLRLLDQLAEQSSTPPDKERVKAIRKALFCAAPLPLARPVSDTVVHPRSNKNQWWEALKEAYREGRVRDVDLLLDPAYHALRAERGFAQILRTYRGF